MARVRTFLGIELSESIRNHLVDVQEKLDPIVSEAKWVEVENLHLTLLFLGEVDQRDVLAVCRAAEGVTGAQVAFEMSIEGIGCFPNPRRPHVLWAGVDQGQGELSALHDALEVPLLELGCYRRENRAYTPHVTLGRLKSDNAGDELSHFLQKHRTWRGGSMRVSEVLIFSSELTSEGPKYTVMARAKLRNPSRPRG